MPDMTISTAQAQQTPPSENTNSEQAGVSLPLTRSIINVSNRSLPNNRENALSNNTQLKMTEIQHDERLGHLPPSDKIVIDSSSFETFINMKEGNALAAVMRYNKEESTVFLIPVKRDDTRAFWQGTDYSGVAKVLGQPVKSIIHNDNGITSHIQAATIVSDILGIPYNKNDWIGFGIRKEQGRESIYFTPRSRSLNAMKFKVWRGGQGQDKAFEIARKMELDRSISNMKRDYIVGYLKQGYTHEQAEAYTNHYISELKSDYPNYQSAPNINKVVVPDDGREMGGRLTDIFVEKIHNAFSQMCADKEINVSLLKQTF